MRRLLLLPACAVAAAAGGCGAPGADLFVAHRTGAIRGAELQMRTIDDGHVVCNGREHELDGHDLILSRVLVVDLEKLAKAHTTLPAGHPSILHFSIRTKDGTVSFSDTSPRQPPVFYRAAQLVRTIAKRSCGLTR